MSLERFFIFKYLFLSISFSFYVKYICKKCYKNFLGAFFWAPIPFERYQNTSGCGTASRDSEIKGVIVRIKKCQCNPQMSRK